MEREVSDVRSEREVLGGCVCVCESGRERERGEGRFRAVGCKEERGGGLV